MEACYGVYKTGGSLGEKSNCFIYTGLTKERAKELARCLRMNLTKGERSYYKLRYTTRRTP